MACSVQAQPHTPHPPRPKNLLLALRLNTLFRHAGIPLDKAGRSSRQGVGGVQV